MTRRDDWLAHQLPVGMTDDDFLMRFLGIFQTVSDTVLHQVDTLPHAFDPSVAPDEMVRLMSRWLGIELVDSSLDDAVQREIVMEYSKLLKWRGTSYGMRRMLEVITKSPVTVTDNGGVYPEGEAPRSAPHVTIEIGSTGWATEEDIIIMVRTELAASCTFELRVGGELVWPVHDPERADLAERAGARLPEAVMAGARRAEHSEATIDDIMGAGSMGPGRDDLPPPPGALDTDAPDDDAPGTRGPAITDDTPPGRPHLYDEDAHRGGDIGDDSDTGTGHGPGPDEEDDR